MNESDGQGAEGNVAKSGKGVKIPFALKAVLWDKAMMMFCLSIILLGMSVPTVPLLFRITNLMRQGKLDHPYDVESVILGVSLPVFFGVILAMSSYMLVRRRSKTGRFLLSTSELKEKVSRDLQPKPMWKRIFVSGIYFLLACNMTYDALSSKDHRGLDWGLAVLMWLCAIIIAALEFVLSRRKQPALAHPQ